MPKGFYSLEQFLFVNHASLSVDDWGQGVGLIIDSFSFRGVIKKLFIVSLKTYFFSLQYISSDNDGLLLTKKYLKY